MDTMEAILTRRSVRAFKRGSISAEDMQQMLQAAAAAATGGNRQPWAFIGVCEPQRVMAIRALSPGMIDNPAAIIAICLDDTRAFKEKDGQVGPMVWMDLGAAMENILLAAHALGLGACAIGSYHAEAVTRLLALPEHLKLSLLISIGAPARAVKAPPKRPFDEVIFSEQYGVTYGK